jgi:hypothetical protein
MALFLDEQTLKDLGFSVKTIDYDINDNIVDLNATKAAGVADAYFYYLYAKSPVKGNPPWHQFSLTTDESSIVTDIDSLERFHKLDQALNF